MASKITLDSNILLRAADHTSPSFTPAKSALTLMSRYLIDVIIPPQVIYECWVVLTRPIASNGIGLSTDEAVSFIEETRRCYSFLPDPIGLLDRWLDLVTRHDIKGVKAHDVRLAAWMLETGIDTLLTFNTSDFHQMPIHVIHPDNLKKWLSDIADD